MVEPCSVGIRHLPSTPSAKPHPDPERPPQNPPPIGYASFSALISSDPDLQIYRRFDRLSARNILYLQSELLEAERLLAEYDAADQTAAAFYGDLDVMLSMRCWESFARKSAAGNARERERMELIRRVRELVKEYRECWSPGLMLVGGVIET